MVERYLMTWKGFRYVDFLGWGFVVVCLLRLERERCIGLGNGLEESLDSARIMLKGIFCSKDRGIC